MLSGVVCFWECVVLRDDVALHLIGARYHQTSLSLVWCCVVN